MGNPDLYYRVVFVIGGRTMSVLCRDIEEVSNGFFVTSTADLPVICKRQNAEYFVLPHHISSIKIHRDKQENE